MTDRDRDLFGTALSCLLGDYPGILPHVAPDLC